MDSDIYTCTIPIEDMENQSDFYMILPSNASREIYTDNSPDHFKIKLPKLYQLTDYEVAMDCLYYTKDLKTILNEEIYIEYDFETIRSLIELEFKQLTTQKEVFTHITESVIVHPQVIFILHKVPVKQKAGSTKKRKFEKKFLRLELKNLSTKSLTIRFSRIMARRLKMTVYEDDNFSRLRQAHREDMIDLKELDQTIGANESKSYLLYIHWFTSNVKKTRPYKVGKITTVQPAVKKALISLKSGYYQNPQSLITMMNNEVKLKTGESDPIFRYSAIRNRMHVYINKSSKVKQVNLKSCQGLLGFREPAFNRPVSDEATFAPDLTRGIQTIYIYSNIVESICIGNKLAPILANIPVSRQVQGIQDYVEFSNRFYTPVIRDPFDTIEVDLRDDAGASLKEFLIGKTMMRLHFRKRVHK